MHEHEARRSAVSEMHLRRWPLLATPCLVVQWLRISSNEDRAAQRAALADMVAGPSFDHGAGDHHIAGTGAPGIRFTWESHSEASSFTLFVADAPCALLHDPATHPALSAIIERAERLPGQVIRATRMWIGESETDAVAALDIAALRPQELVSCEIGDGARIWSDFRIQSDDYGRVVLAANGMAGGALSRLAQRVQELGNYRNLALIGLPVAKREWSRLNQIESELERLGQYQLRHDVTDDDLLDQMSTLSIELMSVATASSFRMNATAAYAQLVEDRMAELVVAPVAGFPSLSDFTQRRFLPAVRTCAAFARRESQLSLRAAQFTSLLRTRIETRIENQNAQLLASMERSASMQLRLQQLVEGISVVALSYYALGLIGFVLKGAERFDERVDPQLLLGLLVLPVLGGIWAVLHVMKKHILH